jgi:DNA-binding CsgD family transcriptional regulator
MSGLENPLRILTFDDYDQLFNVLAECELARSPQDLGERLLESLAAKFGYRNASFFLGASTTSVIQDPEPIFTGQTSRLRNAYLERYWHSDPFNTIIARRDETVPSGHVAALDQLRAFLTPANWHYLETFLFRKGIHSVLGAEIPGKGVTAGLGLQDQTEGRFGARDLARIELLSVHLGNLLSLLARLPQIPAWAATLTPREHEVVSLAAAGLTNRDIANQLHIGIDTVKKQLGAALRKSGCTNRTQLTVGWMPSPEPRP